MESLKGKLHGHVETKAYHKVKAIYPELYTGKKADSLVFAGCLPIAVQIRDKLHQRIKNGKLKRQIKKQ